LQGFAASSSETLQSQIPPQPKNRLPLNRLQAFSRAMNYFRNFALIPALQFFCFCLERLRLPF